MGFKFLVPDPGSRYQVGTPANGATTNRAVCEEKLGTYKRERNDRASDDLKGAR